ncbi:aspartate kinase [Vibrio clamense]|uniref:aspartate kinase n=1 Tax=Vibrio clamense TaxID=2910254 RepID=UPI003D24DD24
MKKPIIVQKFGGTSVGSIERMHVVAEHIIKAKNDGNHVVVVVSAMSGETNRLINLALEVDDVPNARELDVLLSAGEQMSMALLAMILSKLGYSTTSLTGSQAKILTDNHHNNAAIKHIDTGPITELLNDEQIVIVAGFQGINSKGDITTLGRGGSDTSAVTLAGALEAQECQIFTDVDGIYTCDPRVVKNARKIDCIDFPAMKEMARKGAKVLHLPSVLYAHQYNVPLRVLSTFEVNDGSLVSGDSSERLISGLALEHCLVMIHVEHSTSEALQKQCQMLGIEIWSVIQETDWTGVVIKQDAYAKLGLVFDEKIRNSEAVSLLTVVGTQAQRVLSASIELLLDHGIDVHHHFTEQRSLMLVLCPTVVEKAANILHDAYITEHETELFQQNQMHFG